VTAFLFTGGCLSTGTVITSATSLDGSVLAFQDRHYDNIYVADASGVRWVGNSRHGFSLSPSGDRIVWFDGWVDVSARDPKQQVPWPRVMVVHYVATRKTIRVETPKVEDTGGAQFDPAASFDPGGDIILWSDGKPITTPSPGPLTDFVYFLRWSPKSGWSVCERPPRDWFYADLVGYDDKNSPLVMFRSDWLNARRTIWVRPDGSTLEVARQNDAIIGPLVWYATFPYYAAKPGYRFDLAKTPLTAGVEGDIALEKPAAEARLNRLIAERKAIAASRPDR